VSGEPPEKIRGTVVSKKVQTRVWRREGDHIVARYQIEEPDLSYKLDRCEIKVGIRTKTKACDGGGRQGAP